MLDAITTAQLAMNFDQLKLQSTSQNVANMNTLGFKKQSIDNADFNELLQPQMSHAMNLLQNSQTNTQGAFSQTHQPMDVAISGDGYFQVQGEQGLFYTRRGDFQINNQGELTTKTGETVLGSGGSIQVEDNTFTIDAQGAVLINHNKVNQLNIMQFNQLESLQYLGNGLYQSNETPTPSDSKTRVLQGFLEQSNVKSIDEMMDLVRISRHFEASQRIMRTADSLLATAINQLGTENV